MAKKTSRLRPSLALGASCWPSRVAAPVRKLVASGRPVAVSSVNEGDGAAVAPGGREGPGGVEVGGGGDGGVRGEVDENGAGCGVGAGVGVGVGDLVGVGVRVVVVVVASGSRPMSITASIC